MRKTWMSIMLCMLVVLAACSSGNGSDVGDGDSSPNEHSTGDKKTITIAVMHEDPYLVEAARRFEEMHEHIRIEINAHQATVGDGAVLAMTQADMDKFVQTVTTQALAGNASDLIVMNNLPLDKFIARNILMDLNEWIANDPTFDKGQYYLNILETSQSGDGLYSIPINFYLDNVVTSQRSLLDAANMTIDDGAWTWDEFKAIALTLQEHTDGDVPIFANMSPDSMLYQYLNTNYSEFVKEGRANFDTETFRNILQQVRSLYDEGILSTEYMMDPEQTLFASTILFDPSSALIDMVQPDTQLMQMPSFDGQPSGFGYQSMLSFGMNTKSQVQEEAWAFIKFMLSEEMQLSPQSGGFPLNKNALDQKLEESRQMIEQGEAPVPGGQPSAETIDEKIQELKSILEGLKTSAPGDMKVFTIVREEFASFMSGQKSAEEVGKLIHNRVETYLNE